MPYRLKAKSLNFVAADAQQAVELLDLLEARGEEMPAIQNDEGEPVDVELLRSIVNNDAMNQRKQRRRLA